MSAEPGAAHRVLTVRAGARMLALPIESVVETMRPMPVEPLAGAPSFVRGLAVIRGAATPVVDVAELLGTRAETPGRFVTLRLGPRQIALAVEAVLGLSALEPADLAALPPLLDDATRGAVHSVGLLDSQLVLVLRAARVVPDEVWRAVDAVSATR
jgi:purine-binding chemotaxis protein CheW